MNNFILSVLVENLRNNIKVFDSNNGKVQEYGPSYEDLGDYLPILIYYKKFDIIEEELYKVIDSLEKNKYIYRNEGKGLIKYFTRCYSQTDLLWGLILYSRDSDKYKRNLEVLALKCYERFIKKSFSFIVASHLPFTNIVMPDKLMAKYNIFSSDDHGMFIEIYSKIFEITGDSVFLDIAEDIANRLFFSPMFNKNDFLPFYNSENSILKLLMSNINGFKKRESEFQLVKQNSNAMFGLYSLAKFDDKYKEKFNHIVNDWIKRFFNEEDAVFYTNYKIKTREKSSDLMVFHMIELLILAEKTDVAQKIADSYLVYQSSTTGLLPFFHPKVHQELKRMKLSPDDSWLDAEIDFGVALVKLYAKTNNKKYLTAAKLINKGVEQFHRKACGFASVVSIDNGEIRNPIYSTKMTALVAKLSIAIENCDSLSVYDSPLSELLQDR